MLNHQTKGLPSRYICVCSRIQKFCSRYVSTLGKANPEGRLQSRATDAAKNSVESRKCGGR